MHVQHRRAVHFIMGTVRPSYLLRMSFQILAWKQNKSQVTTGQGVCESKCQTGRRQSISETSQSILESCCAQQYIDLASVEPSSILTTLSIHLQSLFRHGRPKDLWSAKFPVIVEDGISLFREQYTFFTIFTQYEEDPKLVQHHPFPNTAGVEHY